MSGEGRSPRASFGKALWSVLGSYTLGIVLMGLLLCLTFYGTIYQTQPPIGMSSTQAAESFFSRTVSLIPLGNHVVLPLPGMWVICCALFVNLLIGGVIRARKGWGHWGVLVAHAGILVLLAGVAMGNRFSTTIENMNLLPGQVYRNDMLDFGLRLHRFTPDFYPGTGKPRSFESDLSVVGADGAEEERAVIRMNEPLRTHGWTFYQMSYTIWNGQHISILSATRNPYENWPKWASYIIAAGLLVHFGAMFVRYMRNGGKRKISSVEPEQEQAPSWGKRLAFAGIGLLVAVLIGTGLMSARPNVERVHIEGYIPWSPKFVERMGGVAVEDGGRLKPFSTYAGFNMLAALGKRSLSIGTDDGKHRITPTEWALDCMLRPELAAQLPVFLVNREEVVQRLGLPELPEKRKRYSYNQLVSRMEEIYSQAHIVQNTKSPDETGRDINALAQNLRQVQLWMMAPAWMLQNPDVMASPAFPRWYCHLKGHWSSIPNPAEARSFAMASLHARKQGGEDAGRLGLRQAEQLLSQELINVNAGSLSSAERRQIFLERLYYAIDPMFLSLGLFIGGFVLFLIGSLFDRDVNGRGRLARAAAALLGIGVRGPWMLGLMGGLVLLTGMILRTAITMRSPVGNTYETIVFIACAGVLITLVIEIASRRGIALAAGLVLGAAACQMGIMYEAGHASDHMDPLVAVLRSNFLLSTHVITIVLGYASALLAGVFSHLFVLAKPFGLFDRRTEDSITRMAYGTLCFSLVFTLIGTVFGGIWGNEAWGRFWGWDPKENGALIIILWQLMLLHARLAGYARVWGLHIGNIIGVIMIGFAWWGVNTLGVGLHSYGFSDAQKPLLIFYTAEGVILIVSLIIWRLYRSSRG